MLHTQYHGTPFLCLFDYDLANVMIKKMIAKAIATSINECLLFNRSNLLLNFLHGLSRFS